VSKFLIFWMQYGMVVTICFLAFLYAFFWAYIIYELVLKDFGNIFSPHSKKRRATAEEVIEDLKEKHRSGVDIEPILKEMTSLNLYSIANRLGTQCNPFRHVAERLIFEKIVEIT